MNKMINKSNIPVRLSRAEIKNLKTSVYALDTHASLYLFGSRTDVTKRGGDIDILLISKQLKRNDLSKIRWHFFREFGEQKLDIVIDDGSKCTSFVRMVFPKAVKL
ncbi:MAG: nucleotidyltransferase domain-containing protein [Epsilonproteobacteria bacterium]|nr:MAG: nucleotidyltransferase domain-containing protein [Campylobacterota bacterium]